MVIQQEQRKRLAFYLFHPLKLWGSGMAGLLLSMSVVCPVYAQGDDSREVISLQNQVAQLREQLNQARSQNSDVSDDSDKHRRKKHKEDDKDSDSSVNASLLPDLVSRINNLEDQQRVMRGELDDLSNQLKTQTDLINKKLDDMNFAAGNGEGSKNSQLEKTAGTGAMATAATASSAKPVSHVANSGTTLKDAQQDLLNGDFQQAETIAKKILSTSEGGQSVNAQFLLAQAQAGQGNFKASALSYFAVYKKFPKSPKAPVALLGVGYSMMKNGRNVEACQALQLLHSKYPNVSGQVKTSASKLSHKAKCS